MAEIKKVSIVDRKTSFDGCPDCGDKSPTEYESEVLVDNKIMIINIKKCPKGHIYGEWKCICEKINVFTSPQIDSCSCGHKLAPELYHQIQNFIRNARI